MNERNFMQILQKNQIKKEAEEEIQDQGEADPFNLDDLLGACDEVMGAKLKNRV